MQKLQDSVFSIVKSNNLSSAVFSYLQPSDEFSDKTPLGGIFSDTKLGWLALGPKFCVIDLRTGLKVAAWTFGTTVSNYQAVVKSVAELPTPLTEHSKQLVISLECDEATGMICIFHINGSQILHTIQTDVVVTNLAVTDSVPDGPFTCFDGVVVCGTKSGEVFAFDLNRAVLLQALKDMSQGEVDHIKDENNSASLTFLPINNIDNIQEEREIALENDDQVAILFNDNSHVDGQFIFFNPDGSIRMKAKRDHVRVSSIQYIEQLGSLAVGYNFGAFQIWNLVTLDLEFTSQVNVECLPVTHFGFQEPCDDPRAFCYLWVVYSGFEEEEFPLAVMYSLTYQGKRMLSDTNCLYEEFLTSAIRFQMELSTMRGGAENLIGGRCVSCHTYSIPSTLGDDGEDSMLNLCQLVWECWGDEDTEETEYGMLLFDLDQWYKDQMPATYRLQSTTFMSVTSVDLAEGHTKTLDLRLCTSTLMRYSHATRLEEHFYPNCLQYKCICLNTSETCVLSTVGIQRQIISGINDVGPTILLNPTGLYHQCVAAGLTPLYVENYHNSRSVDEQRRFLLSVALEARLSCFLKRCAHDWATGSHTSVGCTLSLLVDWSWKRAIDLKQNAKELISPLFHSSSLPDSNICRCLEHCVRQLTHLTNLLDAVLTKCCNLIVPDALSEIEEKFKGIGTVALYFQVVQWFLNVGLLPEKQDLNAEVGRLPYPRQNIEEFYQNRRLKLNRLQDKSFEEATSQSCELLYIDQLIEHECGGEKIYEMWRKGGSDCGGLYPPPSLYSLLRLYLLPDIAEEHKHSLVLYLLVDYAMLYEEYESIIRRLMQFPTMFGLSNTTIKATQAFWHLDHRAFDFALDQLQCLTGNTLSEWQHHVVLSSLLAQKKTQAALQYLHVRKPAPIQNMLKDVADPVKVSRVNDHNKLEDWQSCCSLYLARGLIFEALDVARLSAQHASSVQQKVDVMNFFFRSCRSIGHLSKLLHVMLLPFEEDVFIRYLDSCREKETSDILIMYLLQQSRYLEAQQYNNKLRTAKGRQKEFGSSMDSLYDAGSDRDTVRDTLVDVICSSLPSIASKVAHCVINELEAHPNVIAPNPMSVFVQAKSPKNTFTYKSTFIQDTIGNASETWINRPNMKRGIKRALDIEDTPFICTPKLTKTHRSIIIQDDIIMSHTPPKKQKLDLTSTPKTPKNPQSATKYGMQMSREMETLLEMPDVQATPPWNLHELNEQRMARDATPHSILKVRTSGVYYQSSPVDSKYLEESDDDIFETESNHTHLSDSTAKHLRFTIPTASESGSTPSPININKEVVNTIEHDQYDYGRDDCNKSAQQSKDVTHPFESPPKKLATEENINFKKVFKDNVRGRKSLSMSANSSLSENTSMESIADIPFTLINPRHSHEGKKNRTHRESVIEIDCSTNVKQVEDPSDEVMELSNNEEESEGEASSQLKTGRSVTPSGRRPIRGSVGSASKFISRHRSHTPERADSPTVSRHTKRVTRSRSKTPDLEYISPKTPILEAIPEQPKQEGESEMHPVITMYSATRQWRSRSRTPERKEAVSVPTQLEIIAESPTKSECELSVGNMSPRRRSLRSRSRTPELEVPEPCSKSSPRSLRGRSKTPERETVIHSPKTVALPRSKKSLSRIVLEANAFGKTKTIEKSSVEVNDSANKSVLQDSSDSSIVGCTPIKPRHPTSVGLLDVSFSPIVNKSVLQSSTESIDLDTSNKDKSTNVSKVMFTVTNQTYLEKSVLKSCESSIAEDSQVIETKQIVEEVIETETIGKPSFDITSLTNKSVLRDVSSLITSDSDVEMDEFLGQFEESFSKSQSEIAIEKEKQRIGEIERELDEIKNLSDNSVSDDSSANAEETDESSNEESEPSEESAPENVAEDVISINDSDGETSNSENALHIYENIIECPEEEANAEDMIEVNMEVENQRDEEVNESQNTEMESLDLITQGNYSLLTDDNSVLESDASAPVLKYSSDSDAEDMSTSKLDNIKENTEAQTTLVEMETESEIVLSNQKPNTAMKTEGDQEIHENLDVVDSIITNQETGDNINSKVEKQKTEHAIPQTAQKDTSVLVTKANVLEPSISDVEKTPRRRRRNRSESLNKSEVEVVTKEKDMSLTASPSKPNTRAQSHEPVARKMMTRRASKAHSESQTEETEQQAQLLTPVRRTRSRSKSINNESIVASVTEKSNKKADAKSDVKTTPLRKNRRSLLPNKADLFIIPEMSSEDTASSKAENSVDMTEPTRENQFTRNQNAVIESESTPGKLKIPAHRRLRTPSRGANSESSTGNDAPSVKPAAFDVSPIDPISLLNKKDFEGPPDKEEWHHKFSPHTELTDIGRKPAMRKTRAASETQSLTKAKPSRRLSIETGSPATAADSPRTRRACFNKAIVALHNPKGRRISVDTINENESISGSPQQQNAAEGEVQVTPGRITRRKASTQSNTSQSKTDKRRRSKN